MRSIAVWCGLFLGAGWLDAQVIVSRRVYTEHGRTWRQLWIAKSGSLDFQQSTHSARDHMEPLCSRDGKEIYFVSDRDGTRSANAYAGASDRELWVFDIGTGKEQQVWQSPDNSELHLNGITADGAVLVRTGTELRRLVRRPWRIDMIDPAFNSAAVSPDGRALAMVIAGSLDKEGQSHGARLFVVDTATGRSRVEIGKYESPAWSPDGTRIAAVADDGLAVIDAGTRKEVARIGWPKADRPPEDLVWSPDGKYVLAGLYGENAGSGDPQRDYFLLDLAAGTWKAVLTARKVLWLAGGRLLYLRPVGMAPLGPGSRHSVWTTQLAVLDLSTGKDTALTTGIVLNDDVSVCGH
jgi:dipeptidyl aminopeptidase/acylaminoacyl peptidase